MWEKGGGEGMKSVCEGKQTAVKHVYIQRRSAAAAELLQHLHRCTQVLTQLMYRNITANWI